MPGIPPPGVPIIPLLYITAVVTRLSGAVSSVCKPPHDMPLTAIFVISNLLDNGLVLSLFCAIAQLIASVICEEVDLPLPFSPSRGIGPIATTRKPCEATSDRKFTCSQGEFAHAPLPQAIMGNLLLLLNGVRLSGLKTVCVGNELSCSAIALYKPVPPSSITLDVGLGEDVFTCALTV